MDPAKQSSGDDTSENSYGGVPTNIKPDDEGYGGTAKNQTK